MSFSNLTVDAIYQGNGSNRTFAIPFTPIVDDSSETIVYVRDETDPAAITETLKVEGALNDYTLTDAPDASSFNVNVTFNSGLAPTATQKVYVGRILPLTQTLNMSAAGAFQPATQELAFDRVVAMIQQLRDMLKRAPKISLTSSITEAELEMDDPVDAAVMAWDEDLERFVFVSQATLAIDIAALIDAAMLAALTGQWEEFVLTDAQAATSLTGHLFDGTVYSSVVYRYEVIRGTTVVSNGTFVMQYVNGTWRISLGEDMGDLSGVTFTITQATTIGQLKVAADAGAGNGTIKVSYNLVPA